MNYKTAGTSLLLALTLGNSMADAQSKNIIKSRYRAAPPKAILVELFSYSNKVDYYRRTKQTKNVQLLAQDADSVMYNTVADFNTNFSFCPVYYFFDTNATKVKDRNFAGVLLDNNLSPVTKNIINAADTNYFIVYYGIQASAKQGTNVPQNVVASSFKSNVLDYSFNPLPQYVIYDPRFKFAKKTKMYRYESKKFNISYTDQAAYLDKKFKKFYTD